MFYERNSNILFLEKYWFHILNAVFKISTILRMQKIKYNKKFLLCFHFSHGLATQKELLVLTEFFWCEFFFRLIPAWFFSSFAVNMLIEFTEYSSFCKFLHFSFTVSCKSIVTDSWGQIRWQQLNQLVSMFLSMSPLATRQ